MELLAQIESILFVASKPLKIKKIAKSCDKKESEVIEIIENLKMKYNQDNSGINIISNEDEISMVSNPDNFEIVENFIKTEISSELTKAQLETLTIIAYKDNISRPEIEQIRGVNSAIIIRNLLIRGLIKEKDLEDKLMPVYSLSIEAMKNLSIKSLEELPKYKEFYDHDYINKKLEEENYE